MAPKRKHNSATGENNCNISEGGRSVKHRRSGSIDTPAKNKSRPACEDPSCPPPQDFPDSRDMDGASAEALVAPAVGASKETPEWLSTIEKVVKAVVSIHFCQTHAFDTDGSSSSQATGFVVDAKRGLILTNRHVVGAGPFVGYVIFDNHEECDVRPVYRDPVHDFGFLKFDPAAIKYMTLTDLPLVPSSAHVGTEIRVVGNDAGEKLSILSGVISRLDRNAPDYGDGYCDFNTNYIQAAAAASGGSSGSPVVDLHGNVVALQAGGRCDGATTDYFLPLARPLRTLQCLQKKLPVTRGTIQTQWGLKPFDECRRLGLTSEWEATVRKQAPKETNMLVCEIALPEGPADGLLKEGDVLIKVNGELLTQFVRLDEILDSSVGKQVELLVQRNGKDVKVKCTVGDLHAITPDRYVTVSGATLHDLSYQQARFYSVPVKGVYLCEGGGSFHIENKYAGWLIDTVDTRPTPTLKDFIEVMKTIPDRKRVAVTYRHLSDLHIRGTTILTIDRHWQPSMRLAVRNDETGLWDFSDLGKPIPAEPEVPRKADFIKLPGINHPAAHEIVNSFVRVTCLMPVKMDGYPSARRGGFGVVVNAEKGLVLISRAVVPMSLCDLNVTVADSVIVRAKVVFLHPLQNYAVIQYDPKLVEAPVRSARLSTEYIKQGSDVIFVGFNSNNRIVTAKTTITDITACSVPPNPEAPRQRSINLDAITVDTNLSTQCNSGVLLSEDGVVQALWFNYLGEDDPETGHEIVYHLGQATPSLLPVIRHIQTTGTVPKLRILGIEAYVIQMAQARTHGVSEEWISKVNSANPERHELFMVRKVDSPGHLENALDENHRLQEGDVLLTLNGKLITYARDMDIQYDAEELDAVVVRAGQEKKLKIKTTCTEVLETRRALYFCGMVLQKPHHAVRQQISTLHSEIYVSARTRGSPSYQYGPSPTNFITGVNGIDTPNLDAFIEQVSKIPDNTYFRLRAVTFDNVPWVVTLKKNDHYFPMSEYIRDESAPEGWRVKSYDKDGNGTENANADMMEEISHSVNDQEPEELNPKPSPV